MHTCVRTGVTGLLAVAIIISGGPAHAVPGPWQRTEVREPCAVDPVRRPFFGDLHVHTGVLAGRGVRGHARGSARRLSIRARRADRPAAVRRQGQPTARCSCAGRSTSPPSPITRSCSASAASAHAGPPGLRLARVSAAPAALETAGPALRAAFFMHARCTPSTGRPHAAVLRRGRRRLPWTDCFARPVALWQDNQEAAEELYDRTAACRSPLRRLRVDGDAQQHNLHRNVIFRNAVVPALPSELHRGSTRRKGCGTRCARVPATALPAATCSPSRTTRTPAPGCMFLPGGTPTAARSPPPRPRPAPRSSRWWR